MTPHPHKWTTAHPSRSPRLTLWELARPPWCPHIGHQLITTTKAPLLSVGSGLYVTDSDSQDKGIPSFSSLLSLLILTRTGLPELANKNTRHAVAEEFQINKASLFGTKSALCNIGRYLFHRFSEIPT